jgi:hypothetical protein
MILLDIRELHTHQDSITSHTKVILMVKVKVKESCNRPGVAQRVPAGLGSHISMTFSTQRW